MLTHDEAMHDAICQVKEGLDLHVRAMKQRVGDKRLGAKEKRPEVVRFCVYRGSEPVRDWVDTHEQADQDLEDFARHCVANHRTLQPASVGEAVTRILASESAE